METSEVSFTSLGSSLWGRLSHESALDPQPVVVMATGDGLKGSKGATWAMLSDKLHHAGVSSFLFDFQGLGNSQGPARKLSLSTGVANMRDAIAYIRSQEWVDNRKIAILGSSFGGNVALLYASEDPSIAALALKSPVSFYPETHEGFLGAQKMAEWKATGFDAEYGYEYGFYLDSMDHNTYAAAKKIHCPVLIVHGDADSNVPIRQSMRLTDCLEDVQLISLPGVEHDYAQGNSLEVMGNHLVEWLRARLVP